MNKLISFLFLLLAASTPFVARAQFVVPLENVSWDDAAANQLIVWDDTAGEFVVLTLGTGLSLTGTTLNSADTVTSVFTRTGAVVATAGDYTAAQVTNVPAGSVAGVTVQAAIDEIDGDVTTHTSNTANPHATDIGNLGAGTLAELNTAVTDATLDDVSGTRTPTDNSATNAKLADVATNTIKGRVTAATGDPEDLTPAQALTVLESGGTDILTSTEGDAAYQPLDADLTTWAGITPAAGVGTFLATPSSANLAAAVTDETGSGAAVFGTSPIIATPSLTLEDGFGAAPTVDGQLKFDRTTERLQVGDGTGTNEFYAGAHFDGAFSSLSGTPTTLSGYGITDAASNGAIGSSGLTMTTARLLGRTTAATGAVEEITVGSGLSLSAGELTATGSGLGADSVGTIELDDGADTPGSGDYVRVDTVDQAGFEYRTTAEVLSDIGAAPLASPTFTGTVTIPTPFTLGAVSVTATGTELNFVDGVTSAIQTQLDAKQAAATAMTAASAATAANFLFVPSGANRAFVETPVSIDPSTGDTAGINDMNIDGAINAGSLVFEGATVDDFETSIVVIDPTADRTFTLPDASGTAAIVGGDIGAATATTPSAGDNDTSVATTAFVNTQTRGSKSGAHSNPIVTNPLALSFTSIMHTVFYGATGEVDLPAAAGYDGRGVLVYNTGAFTVTLDPDGTEVIVREGTVQTGGVSITLSSGAGNYVALLSDGTRWITLGFAGTLAQGS